jgi:hypothetical protein
MDVASTQIKNKMYSFADGSPTQEKVSFFMPRFSIDVRERNFAITGVDAIDSCLTFRIKVSLRGGAVREFDLILLAGNGLSGFIEQFDFDPVAGWCGRTCRVG